MATTKKTDAAKKVATKKAVKKVAVKKAVAKKAAPKAAAKVAVKKAAAKKAAPKAAAKATVKKATVKKVAAVKLTPNQLKVLQAVHGKGDTGHTAEKAEVRTLDSLVEKKLVKKGAKDKATGHAPYKLTKLGQKHATTSN